MGTRAGKKAGAKWWERLLPIRSRTVNPERELFPPEFISTLERLRLAALKALGGGLREGHRLGAYKGGQLEFHGHRNYVPGDELRYVDWNTYARLDRPYVKEFAREEAGVLHLLLDATPSMALGQPSKWNFARRVAALFSHVALASKDSVQISIFRVGENLDRFPPNNTRAGIRAYLDYLTNCKLSEPYEPGDPPSAETVRCALQNGVNQFLRLRPQRGRVMLLSDFWHNDAEIVASVGRLTSSGFDVSAIHILAAEEISPAATGELLVRDVEQGEAVHLHDSTDLSARYTTELEHHLRGVETAFHKRGGPYLFARADMSIERVLISTLRQRRWLV